MDKRKHASTYAKVVTLQARMKREFFLQASMEAPMLEKGVMYGEVDTRKSGSTNAEVGLMCDEGDAKALVEAQHSCAAFLQGDFIDREVYVILPKEFTSTRPEGREAN